MRLGNKYTTLIAQYCKELPFILKIVHTLSMRKQKNTISIKISYIALKVQTTPEEPNRSNPRNTSLHEICRPKCHQTSLVSTFEAFAGSMSESPDSAVTVGV